MKIRLLPLYALVLFSFIACSNPGSSSGSGDNSSDDGQTSGGPLFILAFPQTFVYKEIQYNYVQDVGPINFDESELIAVMINREDEEKFLSENHDCDYVIVGSIYNYDDENNRLYIYEYEDYDISEYLVVFTKTMSILFKRENK